MLEQMTPNSSESKRKINIAAEKKFGGSVDVVCSRGHFSYVFSSNLYCEATKDLVTCIAFRQTASA
ncbi:ground-like domain protein [Oesophagostomum dentatum]|uniref:Ground-like domain protein n=1 Tax=Oesophagostomum dentatum TaxID=61180 RepID=A0A0B1SAC1_OESDE|nr:ground-like domain protein [Oesophagostomum dentatum]